MVQKEGMLCTVVGRGATVQAQRISVFPTKNKATYSRIILSIKKCVFTCIKAIYKHKRQRKHMQNLVYTCMHVQTLEK